MPLWSPQSYKPKGAARGLNETTIRRVLEQAHAVQSRGLPAVLTLKHLAEQIGVPYVFLRTVVERKLENPYREFFVGKRAGGTRRISVPTALLLKAQRWIAQIVLSKVEPSNSSVAYAPGSSIIEAARKHCVARWLVKVDIENFFGTISEKQVFHVFRRLGYQKLISFEMARICTHLLEEDARRYSFSRWQAGHRGGSFLRPGIASYACKRIGHLPQGAPTSPMLSNFAMWDFDEHANEVADKFGMTYSRYADDLIFSTRSDTFSRPSAHKLIADVYDLLRQFAFRPQRAKTTISPPGARKVVLGLLVDSERPRLTRSYRDRVESHVYGLVEHGIVSHAGRLGFVSILGMRRHIEGLIAHAIFVDPAFGAEISVRYAKVVWPV